MLILNPRLVTLGDSSLRDVAGISIEREAKRLVTEFTDAGPHVAFADVPEQIVRATITQDLMDGVPDGPRPGESLALSFVSSPTGSDSARMRWSATGVVTECSHEIVASGRNVGARRTIEMVLVSSNGSADPVVVATAGEKGGEL